jgi:hypothetical protein
LVVNIGQGKFTEDHGADAPVPLGVVALRRGETEFREVVDQVFRGLEAGKGARILAFELAEETCHNSMSFDRRGLSEVGKEWGQGLEEVTGLQPGPGIEGGGTMGRNFGDGWSCGWVEQVIVGGWLGVALEVGGHCKHKVLVGGKQQGIGRVGVT